MTNENQPGGQGQSSGQSTGTQGKQQTSEISQGATTQQGSGQSGRGSPDTGYSGHYGAAGAPETGYDQRASQRGQSSQGARSTWQQPSGSALQTRGGTSASPFGSLYGGGPFS